MYGALPAEAEAQSPLLGDNRGHARKLSRGGRAALGFAVIALVGAPALLHKMSASSSTKDMEVGTGTAPAPQTALVADQQEYGGQGGRPFKITTALGEFYFVADSEGISGMEPTIFQYLPNDFSGDAVTPVGGVLKRSLIPEFLCYCAKKVFFTTASKVCRV